MLPKNCDAVIDTKSWTVSSIFKILQENGNINRTEMYQVFNMGIGMAAIVSPADAKNVARVLGAKTIGEIVRGTGSTILSS